jgi:aldose 1-epimerase
MKKFSIALLILIGFTACNNDKDEPGGSTGPDGKAAGKISITEKPFGKFESQDVVEYTLTNANGMQLGIINYGGTITKIITPDKSGAMGDVVTGFESLDGFLQKGNPYFGALIGRYGNRIGGAKFTLDGKQYTLAANDNGNTLHGGNKGYDKVYWAIEKLPGDSSLKLTYLSKDGEEGYPGNLNIAVVYTLTADNAVKLDYTATTDKATPVNLTSHAYFNLSAGKDSTILNHELMIKASAFTEVDAKLIPTGNVGIFTLHMPNRTEAINTSMDFNKPKRIGKDIDSVKGGYDHNWILSRDSTDGLQLAATLYDPASGRNMDVYTTEPGLQFYSGNFLDGSLKYTKGGAHYVNHGALCLETQHYPDSPNKPAFPSTILKPGETYRQTTIYKFSTL